MQSAPTSLASRTHWVVPVDSSRPHGNNSSGTFYLFSGMVHEPELFNCIFSDGDALKSIEVHMHSEKVMQALLRFLKASC